MSGNIQLLENCSWCQFPLNPHSLPNFISRIHSFPCNHQVHQSCLVKWTDQIHRTTPTLKTLSCPECRQVTEIPTNHSAEQILSWVKIAKIVIVATGTILGTSVGLGIATLGKSHSSFIERICIMAQKIIHISPRISFPLTTAGLAFLGSYSLIRSNNQSLSWITNVITSFYNQVQGTNIKSFDVWVYKSGLLSSSSETQLKWVRDFLIEKELVMMSSDLSEGPFNNEEKASLKILISKLDSLQKDRIEHVITLFTDLLESIRPDLYIQIVNLGAHLLESSGNEDLKEELSEIASKCLLGILESENLDALILHDSNMAARLALVWTLELSKEMMEFKNNSRAVEWKSFLSTFQEECRHPTSSLLIDIRDAVEEDFFARPLTQLLWNIEIRDKIFDTLTKIREESFTQAGFKLEFHDEFDD